MDARTGRGAPLGRSLRFFALAAAVGALVGTATLALIGLIGLVQRIGYGTAAEHDLAVMVAAQPGWRVVLVPALGGLLVGLLVHVLPERRYHGIADVMEACAMNSARMPMRSGLAAAAAAALSLGVGAPLGREGPAVHIGASLCAWIAERLTLDRRQSLALLGCGAAAAVAVSFNTPIAAVIFALEVIVGYHTLRVFAPIVIAVMFAMLVREGVLGGAPLFTLAPHGIEPLRELPLFALLGVAGALAARALIRGVELIETGWRASGVPRAARPALAGVAIGLVATELPLVLGTGIEGTALALEGALSLSTVAALLLAKLVLVALALGSGFAGGVFGPAVFVGAMLGSLAGSLFDVAAATFGLAPFSGADVYATIGIAATASALLGAPISTVLIVFELTRDYGVTLGVMTAAAVASTAMQFGAHGSFFRWQLARRDVNISVGRDISLLVTQRCERLVTDRYAIADPAITCGELESRMGTARQRLAMFVDAEGVFHGSVSLSGLIAHAIANGMGSPAIDAAQGPNYAVGPSANIVGAMQSMAERQLEYLPVVEPLGSAARRRRADGEAEAAVGRDARAAAGAAGGAASGARRTTPRRLLGVVLKSDLLAEHYDVVRRAREEEFGIT